jgi:hypothetical protein
MTGGSRLGADSITCKCGDSCLTVFQIGTKSYSEIVGNKPSTNTVSYLRTLHSVNDPVKTPGYKSFIVVDQYCKIILMELLGYHQRFFFQNLLRVEYVIGDMNSIIYFLHDYRV